MSLKDKIRRKLLRKAVLLGIGALSGLAVFEFLEAPALIAEFMELISDAGLFTDSEAVEVAKDAFTNVKEFLEDQDIPELDVDQSTLEMAPEDLESGMDIDSDILEANDSADLSLGEEPFPEPKDPQFSDGFKELSIQITPIIPYVAYKAFKATNDYVNKKAQVKNAEIKSQTKKFLDEMPLEKRQQFASLIQKYRKASDDSKISLRQSLEKFMTENIFQDAKFRKLVAKMSLNAFLILNTVSINNLINELKEVDPMLVNNMKSNPEILADYLSKNEKYQSTINENFEAITDLIGNNVKEAFFESFEVNKFQLSKMQVIAIFFGILAMIGVGIIIGLITLTSVVTP